MVTFNTYDLAFFRVNLYFTFSFLFLNVLVLGKNTDIPRDVPVSFTLAAVSAVIHANYWWSSFLFSPSFNGLCTSASAGWLPGAAGAVGRDWSGHQMSVVLQDFTLACLWDVQENTSLHKRNTYDLSTRWMWASSSDSPASGALKTTALAYYRLVLWYLSFMLACSFWTG